jgi:hypothetical protein
MDDPSIKRQRTSKASEITAARALPGLIDLNASR